MKEKTKLIRNNMNIIFQILLVNSKKYFRMQCEPNILWKFPMRAFKEELQESEKNENESSKERDWRKYSHE